MYIWIYIYVSRETLKNVKRWQGSKDAEGKTAAEGRKDSRIKRKEEKKEKEKKEKEKGKRKRKKKKELDQKAEEGED